MDTNTNIPSNSTKKGQSLYSNDSGRTDSYYCTVYNLHGVSGQYLSNKRRKLREADD